MFRQWALWCAMMLTGCALLNGAPPEGPKAAPRIKAGLLSPVGEDPANQKVQAVLDSELPSVEMDDVKFSDAIEKFRDLTKVQVHVNWNAVKQMGVQPDSRVSVKLANIRAGKVLDILIADAGGGDTVAYIVDGGVVRISNREALSRVTVTRIYDVADLLLQRGNHPFWAGVVPATEILPRGGQYTGDFGGVEESTSGQLFDEETSRSGRGGMGLEGETILTRAELVKEVSTLITELVDPQNWRSAGGTIGSVRTVGSQLVIHNTLPNHKAIETLLAQLRKARNEDKVLTLRARWIVTDLEKTILPADGGRSVTDQSIKAGGGQVVYEGELTFFNGQIVHVVAGNAQTLVATAEPIVGDSSTGLRPVVRGVVWGGFLEATAAIQEGGQMAELKVRNIVAEPRESQTRKVSAGSAPIITGAAVPGPQGQPPQTEIDLPQFTLQSFSTNLIVPLGKSVMVGSTTMPGKDGRKDRLFLVVELTTEK